MSMSMHLLASGPGWRVEDAVCSAGPHDRPFEEQHNLVCVAAVTRGTFEYRTADGRATLVPGALMLSNPGACYECGHEHGVGDRSLSFHFDPGFFEEIVASVPRARGMTFGGHAYQIVLLFERPVVGTARANNVFDPPAWARRQQMHAHGHHVT